MINGTLVAVGDADPVVASVRAGTPVSCRQATVRIVVRAGTKTTTANVVGVVLGIGARQRSQGDVCDETATTEAGQRRALPCSL